MIRYSLINQILILVLILNYAIIASSRIRFHIKLLATQGFLLGIIPLFLYDHINTHVLIISAVLIISKGVVIPVFLYKTLMNLKIKLEVENYISFMYSVTIAGITTTLIFIFSNFIPLFNPDRDIYFIQVSFSTIFLAFLIVTTRLKAISQVIGYFVLENGIFIFGFLISESIPFALELGFILDFIVGIFIMGIVLNHIKRTFYSIDITELKNLREE